MMQLQTIQFIHINYAHKNLYFGAKGMDANEFNQTEYLNVQSCLIILTNLKVSSNLTCLFAEPNLTCLACLFVKNQI